MTTSNYYSWENSGHLRTETVLPYTNLLLNQLKEAAFCLDANAQFLYVNAAFCRLTGFSQEELLSMSLYDIERNDSIPPWVERWQDLKQQHSLTQTTYYRNKLNRVIPIKATLSYMEYWERELVCVFASETSTSETALVSSGQPVSSTNATTADVDSTEAKLEASLALLTAALESTAIGIVAVGNEKTAFYFNKTFAEMWGLPDSVVVTRECERAKAFFESQVKNPEAFRKAIWEASTQTEIESYDVLELKDGRIFAHYAKPQYLNGKIIGRVWSIWDIAKFKQAEAALQADQQPTAAQLALEQTKQLAELKARFISVICHQFRSLLNIISFSNSLVRRHANQWTNDKKQPYLEHIQTAVDQITLLLDEILLFGKSVVGHLQPEPISLDLDALCRELIEQMQPLSDENQQTIVFTSQGNCWTNADPKLLQPMLTNLLSNAIKYSPVGSTIHFKLVCQTNTIVFEIQDSGIGMSDADQQRLFEPFYRGSNVGELPGTGLGLATVKNLVDTQGGQMNLTSKVGIGTTVVIMLPILSCDSAQTEDRKQPE